MKTLAFKIVMDIKVAKNLREGQNIYWCVPYEVLEKGISINVEIIFYLVVII